MVAAEARAGLDQRDPCVGPFPLHRQRGKAACQPAAKDDQVISVGGHRQSL